MAYLVVVKHYDEPLTGKYRTTIGEYVTQTDADNRKKLEQEKLERSKAAFNRIMGYQRAWPGVAFVGFGFDVVRSKKKGGRR